MKIRGMLGVLCVIVLAACTPGPAASPTGPVVVILPTVTPEPPTNTPISLEAVYTRPVPTDTPTEPPAVSTVTEDPPGPTVQAVVVDLGIIATEVPTVTPTVLATSTPVPLPPPVITRFTSDTISVDALDLALRAADVSVSWQVDYRASGTNLVFEQVFPDGRTFNVERPRHFVEVPSVGTGSVIPYLPGGDAESIRLRLRVIRMDTRETLAREDLVVLVDKLPESGYSTASGTACFQPPYIATTGLQAGARGIVGQNVLAGLPLTAISGVGGQVVGGLGRGEAFNVLEGPFCYTAPGRATTYRQWKVRSELSGLEGWTYEYSGTARSYEQYMGAPRSYRIYDASACYDAPFLPDRGIRVGYAAQLAPSMTAGITLDANTADRIDGQMGGEIRADEIFTVVEGPYCFRMEPAPENALGHRQWRVRSEETGAEGWVFEYADERLAYIVPATSGDTLPGLQVVTFDVQPRTVDAGAPLTISWEVTGVNGVSVWMWHAALRSQRVPLSGSGALLPLAGSLTITAPEDAAALRFTLFEDSDAASGISVRVSCRYPWFAAGDAQTFCPNAPATDYQAAYQPFERGYMVWFANTIWVITQSGSGYVRPDQWTGGEVTFEEAPPEGLYQPVRGFGTLWVSDPNVRDVLGWATAPEQGYTMRLQQTESFHRPGLRGGYFAEDLLFSLPDGRTVGLERTSGGLRVRN